MLHVTRFHYLSLVKAKAELLKECEIFPIDLQVTCKILDVFKNVRELFQTVGLKVSRKEPQICFDY